ncbi:hypothetical protein K501DRAFT_282389 [Backusella circina FSU 941]|nr:hypothetical protein K501DRAFT_282389 [Backusella circina FSU 941]
MSNYLDRVRKDRKRGRLPYRESIGTFRVVPEDEYILPESPVVIKETWREHEARHAKRRKSSIGLFRSAFPQSEPIARNELFLEQPEPSQAESSNFVIHIQNKENVPLHIEQTNKDIAKSASPPPTVLTQQDNAKEQDHHQPPTTQQQETHNEPSEDERNIRFDMDMEVDNEQAMNTQQEKEPSPIVDRVVAETREASLIADEVATEASQNNQEMASQKETSPNLDEIIDLEKETIDEPTLEEEAIDDDLASKQVESQQESNTLTLEKQVSNDDIGDDEMVSKESQQERDTPKDVSSSPEKEIIEISDNEEMEIAENEVNAPDKPRAEQRDQPESSTHEQSAPSPEFDNDDNYSIDYDHYEDEDQVVSEKTGSKGKERAVEIHSPTVNRLREEVLEERQLHLDNLHGKRSFEYAKNTKFGKTTLAVLECILTVVFFTAREFREMATDSEQQSIIEGFYENYRIFMEHQEFISIKRRQIILKKNFMVYLAAKKKKEVMESNVRLFKLKRDIVEMESQLEKIKDKYNCVSELDNLFSRIKNKSRKRSPSIAEE